MSEPTTTNTNAPVKLQSSDGDIFQAPCNVVVFSHIIKLMIEDLGHIPIEPLPLPKVNSRILALLIDVWKHLAAMDVSIVNNDSDNSQFTQCVDELNQLMPQPITTSPSDLVDIIVATDYLDSKQALAFFCDKFAHDIRGKSVGQLRTYFGVTSDFTPDEEAQLNVEVDWA